MAVPLVATGLAFSVVGSGSLTFIWTDPNAPAATPKIYGSADGSTFTLLATLLAGVATYTSSNLSPNTSYSFKVGLNNIDGETLTAAISTTTATITPITTTPSLGLTFQDLLIRVAEYLGIADYTSGAAGVPIDAHDLDLCKRIVNDGYARFCNEYKWEFFNVEMQLVPDGLNFQFDLPYDFQGEFLTTWTYPSSGPVAYLKETSEEHIRILRAGRTVTGYPSLFSVEPKSTVDETTTTARWRVTFWPTPVSTIEVLTARYRRFPMKLTNLTDRAVPGPMHDQTVKQAAMAAAEIQRYGQAGPQETLYASLLSASIKRDVRNVPRNLGYVGDGSDGASGPNHWPSRANQVDSYNGISVGGPT